MTVRPTTRNLRVPVVRRSNRVRKKRTFDEMEKTEEEDTASRTFARKKIRLVPRNGDSPNITMSGVGTDVPEGRGRATLKKVPLSKVPLDDGTVRRLFLIYRMSSPSR